MYASAVAGAATAARRFDDEPPAVRRAGRLAGARPAVLYFRAMTAGRYRELPPLPSLAPYVACFWTRSAGPQAPPHRVLPDGAMDLILDFQGSPRVLAVGTMTEALVVPGTRASDAFGVRFRPGAFGVFVPEDARHLTDVAVPIPAVLGIASAEMWERLRAEPGAASRAALMQRWLLAGLHRPPDSYVAEAVRLIEGSGGWVGSARLAARLGLGERQIERRFAERVGISPRRFARVIRFQRAVAVAGRSPSPDWARLALETGYVDQAHLIREFQALAGVSPTRWLSERSNPAPRASGRLHA